MEWKNKEVEKMLVASMGVIGGFLTPVFSLDRQRHCVYFSDT